ncbi:hypothetical protein BHM03_00048414 [Ensete ventricosum]|nr:hypothetical protein BHM03_00048414 [Ensete ventricosum]
MTSSLTGFTEDSISAPQHHHPPGDCRGGAECKDPDGVIHGVWSDNIDFTTRKSFVGVELLEALGTVLLSRSRKAYPTAGVRQVAGLLGKHDRWETVHHP